MGGHKKIFAHPRVVAQQTEVSCWAAALESWFSVVNDPARAKNQPELMKDFPLVPNGKDFNKIFRMYVTKFGMSTQWMSLDDFPVQITHMLAKWGVLFIAYHCESTSPWYHDVILYGVDTDDLGLTTYLVMNPSWKWSESRKMVPAGYQTWRRDYFFPVPDDNEVLVGWREKNSPGKVY